MRLLVLTEHHALVPMAWRLTREKGAEVETVILDPAYERCGAMPKSLVGKEKDISALATLWEDLPLEEAVVLTDSVEWTKTLEGVPRRFGTLPVTAPLQSAVRAGAWFDNGWHARHLVIVDIGTWLGGQGAQIPGAMTVVRAGNSDLSSLFPAALESCDDALKSAGFKGLVQVDLVMDDRWADGTPAIENGTRPGAWPIDKWISRMRPGAWQAGWHWLHGHAFLAALGEKAQLQDLLAGTAEPVIEKTYSVVIPVSLPPWPASAIYLNEHLYSKPQIRLDIEAASLPRLMVHDVEVQGRELWTAGSDGLIGVARGSADQLELARWRALSVIHDGKPRIRAPGLQYRADAGQTAVRVLCELEDKGG